MESTMFFGAGTAVDLAPRAVYIAHIPVCEQTKKTPFGVFFCVLYSFGDFVSAALPLGLPAGKLAAAVGLAVQTILPRKRDGPLIAALFLKIRG